MYVIVATLDPAHGRMTRCAFDSLAGAEWFAHLIYVRTGAIVGIAFEAC